MLKPDVLAIHNNGDSKNQVILDLHIPAELSYFLGQFPNMPVLPGVVQVDWAIHYAHHHLPVTGDFIAIEHIKFQSLVLPDAILELALNWHSESYHLEFSFTTRARKYSSGRILFGAPYEL